MHSYYLATNRHLWCLRVENGTPYPMDAPLLGTPLPEPTLSEEEEDELPW